MSEVAAEQPLLCVVDDAQWLDRASARVLAFVARRLLAERIAMTFAARGPIDSLAGLAELHLGPLGHRDARALLDSVLPGRLDERVVERIVAETRGNPLALLELPRRLTPASPAASASVWIKADRLHPLVPRSTDRFRALYRQRVRLNGSLATSSTVGRLARCGYGGSSESGYPPT